MNRIWSSFKSHPYATNVIGYTTLFATADLFQQSVLTRNLAEGDCKRRPKVIGNDIEMRERADNSDPSLEFPKMTLDSKSSQQGAPQSSLHLQENRPWLDINLSQTARVALVGFCFHANFNYNWLKALERMLPGGGAKQVSCKVLLDQLVAAPATISVFYIGLTALERREDPFEDWREKFWTSYKAGVVYWSIMQAVNFSLVPPVARTVFVGGITLVWTIFLCHLRQNRS